MAKMVSLMLGVFFFATRKGEIVSKVFIDET